MASSVTSSKPTPTTRKGSRKLDDFPQSREITPIVSKSDQITPGQKDVVDLAAVFKGDLTDIRGLVTCSICDQLLYEPWTLGCGHTYCYSCLCNWFIPNRRKKTCPECRSKVKQRPAPSFLVKQLVEIFTKRIELMPLDESVEQHTSKRAEEIADVEKDKESVDGLFKGTFLERGGELRLDPVDGVMRCRDCGYEHEGGRSCNHCGVEFDEDESIGFSDIEEEDFNHLENLELDLDTELRADRDQEHYLFGRPAHFHHHMHHHHHHPHHFDEQTDTSISTNSDDAISDSESEEAGSLQDFVVQDDDEDPVAHVPQNRNHPGEPISISDDDSEDEGGPVSSLRRPHRLGRSVESSSPVPTVLTTTDESNDSEAENSEAEMLRHAGWSPLHHDDDSEAEDCIPYSHGEFYPYGPTEDEHDSDDGSDTETIGNRDSDDEDDRRDISQTPIYENGFSRPGYPPRNPYVDVSYRYPEDDADDDDSDAGQSNSMDRDGDTEMSVSPSAGRSVSVSTNNTGDFETGAPLGNNFRISTDEGQGFSRRGTVIAMNDYENHGESLGMTNNIQDINDDSSDDGPIRPPRRRRQPRSSASMLTGREYGLGFRDPEYDPRISRIFANHQAVLLDQNCDTHAAQASDQSADRQLHAQYPYVDDLRSGPRDRAEAGSRARRSTSYHLTTPRNLDPLRSARSPSVTRVIASNRGTRAPRQYVSTYNQ